MGLTGTIPQALADLPDLSGRANTEIGAIHAGTAPVEAIEAGHIGSAAYAEALDGSERKLLLAWIAATHPAVVDCGARWLAEYHTANAERRRTVRSRKAKDRRRRRRADSRART
jgi:hypothetical protein